MIVLLTDFGESEYVGIMKGVILSHDSHAHIVDLTHSILPQSIREAAWILLKSYKYFPRHSIFTCVVDPGVGTSRDAVLVETPDYVFIGPDNGLLFPAVEEMSEKQIYSIRVNSSASHTFHGRDVFAVAAGQYHSGLPVEEIGSLKHTLDVRLLFYLEGRDGEVVRIDRFGNIITNIPPMTSEKVQVTYGTQKIMLPLCKTYAEGPSSGLFVVVGSYNTLEIASQNKSAVELLPVTVGGRITIQM
jgi:S-adenosylmethionine hydrolase